MSPVPNPGDHAPNFRLTSHESKPYALEHFAGRPLVLAFVRHLA
jgi:peroxiredoxin